MHTPAGFALDPDGIFQVVSWWDAIFNPSFPYRLAHMVMAAYIAGMFVVVGVSGFYLWRRRHLEFARTGLSIAMWILLVLVPAQIVIGDHARAQHAEAPAGQGRRDGGRLGDAPRPAPGAVRLARRNRRAQRLRGCDPEARQPDPDA